MNYPHEAHPAPGPLSPLGGVRLMFSPSRLSLSVVVPFVLVTASLSAAEDPLPRVTATYESLQPSESFAFTLEDRKAEKKTAHTRSVGVLRWSVPATEFGTSGLGRNFVSYCAEPLVGVTTGKTYRFDLQKP